MRLIPTEPLCDRMVEVVAKTPVPTIRLTIKNVALISPSCRPCGRSGSETDTISASTSSEGESLFLKCCRSFSSISLALALNERAGVLDMLEVTE